MYSMYPPLPPSFLSSFSPVSGTFPLLLQLPNGQTMPVAIPASITSSSVHIPTTIPVSLAPVFYCSQCVWDPKLELENQVNFAYFPELLHDVILRMNQNVRLEFCFFCCWKAATTVEPVGKNISVWTCQHGAKHLFRMEGQKNRWTVSDYLTLGWSHISPFCFHTLSIWNVAQTIISAAELKSFQSCNKTAVISLRCAPLDGGIRSQR